MRVRLSLALLLSSAVAAQTGGPGDRARGSFVRLDLYASEAGRDVADLTRDEVQLFEDGVEQPIDGFTRVEIAPDRADRRVFVIFLDTYHTGIESSGTLRLPLIRWLDRLIGPDDLVALTTPEADVASFRFGDKASAISDIMQPDWSWGRRRDASGLDDRLGRYQACFGASGPRQRAAAGELEARRREARTLDALEALVLRVGNMREERKAIVTISDGWRLHRPNASLAGGRGLTRDESAAAIDRVECEADRVALADLDHTGRVRQLAELANRATASFYPVTVREGGTQGEAERDSLAQLAAETGGTWVRDLDDEAAAHRIAADLSGYYLLSYYSTNARLDGRFREVAVQVRRQGVRVSTRRGYRGPTADDLLQAALPGERRAADESSDAGLPAAGASGPVPFRIRTSSWMRDVSGGASGGVFWVVGELDYRLRRELTWTAGAEADVLVIAADGTEVMSRTVAVETADGAFVVAVPETGGLAPGEYAVSVRVRATADDASLSGTARVAFAEETPLGEPVFWRRGPSTGLVHQPTADARFQRSERVRVELPTRSTETATARLLDRSGNPLEVPLQVGGRAAEPSLRWIVVDLILAPFAPGQYTIEVVQGAMRRSATFQVVP